MFEKYTFLFYPIEAVGHFNACIGIAEQLRDRGHRIVFLTPPSWKGKLAPQGFIEEFYTTSEESQEATNSEKWGEIIASMAPALALPHEEKCETLHVALYQEGVRQIKYTDKQFREIMAKVKPDVVVVDTVFHAPGLVDQGVPWVLSASVSPLGISSKHVPPAFTGLPTDGDPALWKNIEERGQRAFKNVFEDLKNWVMGKGGSKLEYRQPFFNAYSPFANIYMYPSELDYTMLRPNPPLWHRFDAFVRNTECPFEIPEKLKTGPGKLIYFSMGTIGCSELGLMRRMVSILGKSPNRFIVSKGPLADKFELAENMWGAASVPQTKVIPLVDLVITHGGNNSITESFYFGKRVLVLPLFCDQLDNGQRIFETGLGLQFHPYKVAEQELLDGIEYLLRDELLERRMKSISKRIQASNSQARAADVVEQVARNNRVK